MSYTPPFIPRADAAFRTKASNFARNISKYPARFMMSPAEAAGVQQAYDRFAAALGVATDPATRTRGAIVAKDDARSILRTLMRQYAAFIRFNDGITDGDKIIVGVRPRNIAHNKRTCPGISPLLNYIGSEPGVDYLTFKADGNSKAKPRGAERLELWVAYSKPGEPTPKVSQARPIGSFKKSKLLVNQDLQLDSRMEGDGKPTYWARWAGYDGAVGPWSLAVTLAPAKPKAAKATPDAAKSERDSDAADDQSLPTMRKAA